MIAAADEGKSGISSAEKYAFFSELLQSYGRTTLVLHGGSMFGLCHMGVMKTLYECGMLPRIICGSYVGAIVASFVCIQDPRDLPGLFSGDRVDLGVFASAKRGGGASGSWKRKIVRFLKQGHLLDIRVLEQCARDNMGDITFKEAFQKSGGRILNIYVYSKRKDEVPVLFNYLTAPDVVIWSAACASCILPGVYDTVTLMTKDERGNLSAWSPLSKQMIKDHKLI